MAKIVYPEKNINTGGNKYIIPFIRRRRKFKNYDKVTIVSDISSQSPPHTYSTLAFNYYGDVKSWYLIDDINPLIHECDIEDGFKVNVAAIDNEQNISI